MLILSSKGLVLDLDDHSASWARVSVGILLQVHKDLLEPVLVALNVVCTLLVQTHVLHNYIQLLRISFDLNCVLDLLNGLFDVERLVVSRDGSEILGNDRVVQSVSRHHLTAEETVHHGRVVLDVLGPSLLDGFQVTAIPKKLLALLIPLFDTLEHGVG